MNIEPPDSTPDPTPDTRPHAVSGPAPDDTAAAPTDPAAAAEPAAGPAPASEVRMPLFDLELANTPVGLVRDPETGKRTMVFGPVMLRIGVPLDPGPANDLARALTGGIIPASAIPPAARIQRR